MPNFRYSRLSFVILSWGRTMDKLAINWQNFAKLDSNSNLLLEYGR